MKLTNQFKLILAMTVMGSGLAQAALIDRGGGMIYDDVLDVTWLQDANYAKTSGYDADGRMTYNEANTWVQNLSYGGYNDWRLPEAKPVNGNNYNFGFSMDGSTDYGYSITSTQNEQAYMYYVNLGNDPFYDANSEETGCLSSSPNCLTNTGPFQNLQANTYWTSSNIGNSGRWFTFTTNYGNQYSSDASGMYYAWAVRSGDVAPVPVPAAVWLFGSALIGLVSVSGKKKDIL